MKAIHMEYLKDIKGAIVSSTLHSTYVRLLINTWSSKTRITTTDWLQLVLEVLEYGPPFQWKSYWREEEKALEQQSKIKGYKVSQILGEVHYSDINNQATYNEHNLFLCHTSALNTWDKIQELGKRNENSCKVTQGLKEAFSDFL